jgi:ligand-binding sensor domain-containing protein
MRKIIINGLFMMLFLIQYGLMYSQQKIFEQVTFPKFDQSNSGVISGITQDNEGYIWLIVQNKGLYRYDGSQFVSYVHDGQLIREN